MEAWWASRQSEWWVLQVLNLHIWAKGQADSLLGQQVVCCQHSNSNSNRDHQEHHNLCIQFFHQVPWVAHQLVVSRQQP